MTREVLLEGMALGKRYAGRRGVGFLRRGDPLDAVHEVSLRLHAGETLGLVGESGSGKSTCARLLLRLEAPTRGRVAFRGRDLSGLTSVELRDFRRSAQIVFQDPFASLNPRLTIGGMLREVLRVHGLATGAGIDRRVTELLELVGLEAGDAGRYPHEFSGGQRQRVGIARALSVEPEVVVADEPVSALDLSVQAQILNLLAELQDRLGLSYLLIAHDLAVVRHMCDRVAVMFRGRIVEEGPTESLYSAPRHPYTRDLLASVPGTEKRDRGETPHDAQRAAPARPPAASPGRGCPFYPRCRQPTRDEACLTDVPALEQKAPDHLARCVKT